MEKKLGLIVGTDGTTKRVHFDNDNTYEVMSSAVGGWVEAVRLSDSLTMWVNEEGKFMGLDVNKIGTIWFENAFGEYSDDVIVGDVFFTGGVDARGYTKGISVNQASSIEYAASDGAIERVILRSLVSESVTYPHILTLYLRCRNVGDGNANFHA